MNRTIKLHVGSVEDMGKRLIGAWRKLEQGTAVDETHLTFLDLEPLVFDTVARALSAVAACPTTPGQ